MQNVEMKRTGAVGTPGHLPGSVVLRRPGRLIAVPTAIVVLICVIGAYFKLALGVEYGPANVILLLDMYEEATLPAWYSSTLLLLCALMLAVIGFAAAAQRERFARYWQVLAAIFLLLAIDENISLHERLSYQMRHFVEARGWYHYAWVIPGMLCVLVLGLLFLRFVLSLPRRTRNFVVLAGATFLAGALGMEMIEGMYHSRHGDQTPVFAIMVMIEETLEMAGSGLFLYALLDYARSRWGTIQVRMDAPAHPAPSMSEREPTPASSGHPRPGPAEAPARAVAGPGAASRR